MNKCVAGSRGTLILYDSGQLADPDARSLKPDWWLDRSAVRAELGGRSSALLVETEVGPAVLRRYHRGGWMAPLLKDRYWRSTPERSRAFCEFRLLSQLRHMGLPVPQALAASFEPAGLFYRAGLMTRFLPDCRPLAELAAELGAADWQALAAVLRRCFRAGLVHPDLNAHNLLLDAQGQWHVLDFDRARLRRNPVKAAPMIRRLERSLAKYAVGAWRTGFETYLRRLN